MIDLHTHSTVSDGTDPPEAVVALAADAGCHALSITDHDTLEHVAAAVRAGAEHGVRVVPGCELSCEVAAYAPGTMHLLVYFVEPDVGPLPEVLSELQEGRDRRNERIVAALHDQGIDIDLGAVRAVAGDGTVGRPHIARVLVDGGHATSIQDAFDRWLAKGRPAYQERERLTPERAIELAHASGAVTSLAHPDSLGLDPDAGEKLVAEWAEDGLDALEADYGRYTPEERAHWREMARRHGLEITGGSDYHGEHKPGLSVCVGTGDLAVPDEVLDRLEARRP